MNITWLANCPWGKSGYGEQTALFARRFRALGHNVSIVCNWGLYEIITTWEGFTVYPADHAWGNTNIATYAKEENADLVLCLCDAWVMDPDCWPDLNMAIWAPVDHYPIPPKVLKTLMHDRVMPIAMSRFGEQQMNDCNLNPLYVPHGYDPLVFKPMPDMRDAIRDKMGIPRDAFLACMVAANKSFGVSRKAFPQAFHAFANLQRQHADAYLYVHCDPHEGSAGSDGGQDLIKLRKMLGIPDGHIMFPSDEFRRMGIPNTVVAQLYAAADVLLSPSMGEGFGVPLIEAQAVGCPVIASDHSAMTELSQVGWSVQGDPWWDAAADSFFIVPFIGSITNALEQAYEARGDQRIRQAAAEFAQPYNADLVTVDYWVPALEALAPKTESRQVRRARERREAKARARVPA